MPRSSTRPTGMVTFLFTDIEGSTRMWDQAPETMTDAMARHDELLYSLIEAREGLVFKHTGDGVCAVFQSTNDALEAALAVRDAFQAEAFAGIGRMSIRVAIHAGEAEELEGDYRGPALNRAARLLDLAVGGDILLTNTAEEMLRATLPPDIELADLGQKRLRGISQPGHVFFVGSSPREEPRRVGAAWMAATAAMVVVAAAIAVLSLATTPGTHTPEPVSTTAPESGPVATAPPPPTAAATVHTWATRPGGTLAALTSHAGVVIAASRSTGLHAYRADDGQHFWPDQGLIVDLDRPLVEPFGAPVLGTPAIGQGMAFYSTSLGTLHAVELNSGELRWWHRFERCLGGECTPIVPSEPAFGGESVYVAAGGELFRFSAATGDFVRSEGGFGSVTAGPAVGGDHLYVAEGQTLLQYRTTDLSLAQTIFVGEGIRVGYPAGVTSITTTAMESVGGLEHGVFLTDEAGFLTRRSAETGSLHAAWVDASGESIRIPTATEPVVGPGIAATSHPVLWAVDPAGMLVGIDAVNGSLVADHPVGPTTYPAAIGGDGTIYVATDTAELVGYDPAEDTEKSRVPMTSAPGTGPVEVDESVFVAETDGTVRGYGPDGAVEVEVPPTVPIGFSGPLSDVAWSSDGRLAFVFDGDVWVTDAGGFSPVNLTARTGGGSAPDWSPSGESIAYVAGTDGKDIYLIEPDGTGRRNLTNTAEADESAPVWAPDGRRIAFVSQACIGDDASSERLCSRVSELRILTLGGRGMPLAGTPSVLAADREPDWMPGGDRLVFDSDRLLGVGPSGARHLWIVRLDGTGLEPFGGGAPVAGRAPAVSPDADGMAFISTDRTGGPPAVYVTQEEGTPVPLTDLPLGAGSPAWSPDGTRLAFAWELSALGRVYTIGLGTS